MFKQPLDIPSQPGIYFFKDRRGKILYIGKAVNLKSRLGFYWRKTGETRLSAMLEQAVELEWETSASAIEALILEARLIKKHRPTFNIKLRDDKQYFYVVFTKELFPKILITHQPHSKFLNLGTSSIGPFTNGLELRIALKTIRRHFPYCTCKQRHYRPCLNAHLDQCPGYCCLKNQKTEKQKQERAAYQKNIGVVKKILSGKRVIFAKQLAQEMRTAAKQEDFARAIVLRNQITKLRRIFAHSSLVSASLPTRFDLSKYQSGLEKLQTALKLPRPPRRIEGYDLSSFQGKFAVGSLVVFTDGQPDKAQYRKFKIKKAVTADDPQMLAEILTHRLHHSEWPRPDLILVDGGKGQLNAAHRALSGFKFLISKKVPVVALAKNEKHQGHQLYTSSQKEAVPLKDLPSAAVKLILQIDAEAHRFALNYHRFLHCQKMKTGLSKF